jgi:hypothetical protein
MTSRTENAKKRKQTAEILEAVISSDDDRNNRNVTSKTRRVSTNNALDDTPVVTVAVSAANTASATKDEDSIESIGQMVQDLAHSDNDKVSTALDGLDFSEDNVKRCKSLVTVGGCFALVQLVNKCLEKAIDRIPACDQVTELIELAELAILNETLIVIIYLTLQHKESRDGITAIGGVKAVVKVMKTFPKCRTLQEAACASLVSLTGDKKAIESGGIEVLLAVLTNHLGASVLCTNACWTLYNVVIKSKKDTGLLISLGGGAAVANVRTKWPDDDMVQSAVKHLTKLIVEEMSSWM